MSTRIVVLADTHMPRRGRKLPSELLAALAGANLILHLGDFTGIDIVKTLESFGPLCAVHGNNDSAEVRARFPASQRIEVRGHALHLLHGDIGGHTALQAARAVHDAEVVLFGHSHQPWCSYEEGRLLFNPGSPTDRRWAPQRSFGMLVIGERIVASLVKC